MSYRRAQSELSYPFIRSVFIVVLLVFIYALQQMSDTAPARMKFPVPERFVSSRDIPSGQISQDQISQSQISQEQSEQTAESENAMSLFFSDFLLTLRR